ncbi:MAG: hypothetical protein JSV52_00605 [Candidatus Zixiibacteriota bacterium]|nr:MAG: hypothetical protein JSV52_00605 [candidate division Zixibacteria bacterium]
MKKTLLITIILIIALAATTSAEEITLKHYFFGGWKYSVDGHRYQGVGWDGGKLKARMAGNDAAVAEMNKVKSRKTLSMVTGIPGGFCLGWTLGEAIWGEWDSTDDVLLAIGIPLTLVSMVADASANKHMKEAVKIFNGEEQALMLDINYKTSSLTGSNNLTLALNFTF